MAKNLIIVVLLLVMFGMIGWQYLTRPAPPKPQVYIFLPDGYCGQFVVYWGENTPEVDEPAEFLSYNIYPTHPNAVVINLPKPYERAGLRFVYVGQNQTLGRNPVFKRGPVGSFATKGTRKVHPDGSIETSSSTVGGVAFDYFEIGTTINCETPAVIDDDVIADLYFELTGTSFNWTENE